MHDSILRYRLRNRSKKGVPRRIFLSPLFFLFLFSICLPNSFAEEINSQAAVVMNASTGEVLIAKNSEDLLPPASTVKLMTAIIVMEKANLSEIVTISQKAAHARPFKVGFKKGDRVTIETLLFAALLKSANDAAVALAEAIAGSEENFVPFMNEKAARIGAINTRFINATGLPGIGQFITALDLSKILKYAMSYPKLRGILATPSAEVSTEKGKAIFLKNTDKLLWSDEDVIGGKTGYTNSAKHCFVFAAERDGETVIVSLLGSPTRKNLWKEAKKLADKGFEKIAALKFRARSFKLD
jgi:D-alanyl-D-alanine carboxypeptidase (penicillin-binding protein 5/6)